MPVRQFQVPVLNFDADDYIDFVAWQNIDRYDSPIMNNYSVSQIRAFIDNTDVIQLPHFPCHIQAVERCIKLVTKASDAVCGQEQRDGFIQARIESRTIMKTFNTKAEYQLL